MVITKEMMSDIKGYIENHKEEALNFYRELVEHEGQHGEYEKLAEEADFIEKAFKDAGLETKMLDAGENNAPVVIGTANPDAIPKPIVFLCHYDTIYASGTYGKEVFKIEDDRVYGPGVADAKGGIVIALYTVKALMALGFTETPLKIIAVGDEEVDHRGGKTIDIIENETNDIIVAFNMEPRDESGELCVGRMGSYKFTVKVKGISAHSGAGFDEGANAIEELAYKIVALRKLTPKKGDRDFTVSVDTVKGGTVFNQIPGYAEASLDVRVRSNDVLEEVEQKIEKICEKTHVDGTSAEYEVSHFMIPFEMTDRVTKAYNAIKAVDDTIGGSVTGHGFSAGASDAAYVARVGSSVVCQCGITGKNIHTDKEEASLESMWEAIRLFISAAYNWRIFL
jgi:glutamate carboxypeptidase